MTPQQESIEAQLCAYIEGDLDAAGRARIEKHLAANPRDARLLAELMQARDLLRDIPFESAPSDLTETMQNQLERSVLLGQGVSHAADTGMRINRWPQIMSIAAIVALTIGLGAVIYSVLPSSGVRPTNTVAGALPDNQPHEFRSRDLGVGGPMDVKNPGRADLMPKFPQPYANATSAPAAPSDRDRMLSPTIPLKAGDAPAADGIANVPSLTVAGDEASATPARPAPIKSLDNDIVSNADIADLQRQLKLTGAHPKEQITAGAANQAMQAVADNGDASAGPVVVLVNTADASMTNGQITQYLADNNLTWKPAAFGLARNGSVAGPQIPPQQPAAIAMREQQKSEAQTPIQQAPIQQAPIQQAPIQTTPIQQSPSQQVSQAPAQLAQPDYVGNAAENGRQLASALREKNADVDARSAKPTGASGMKDDESFLAQPGQPMAGAPSVRQMEPVADERDHGGRAVPGSGTLPQAAQATPQRSDIGALAANPSQSQKQSTHGGEDADGDVTLHAAQAPAAQPPSAFDSSKAMSNGVMPSKDLDTAPLASANSNFGVASVQIKAAADSQKINDSGHSTSYVLRMNRRQVLDLCQNLDQKNGQQALVLNGIVSVVSTPSGSESKLMPGGATTAPASNGSAAAEKIVSAEPRPNSAPNELNAGGHATDAAGASEQGKPLKDASQANPSENGAGLSNHAMFRAAASPASSPAMPRAAGSAMDKRRVAESSGIPSAAASTRAALDEQPMEVVIVVQDQADTAAAPATRPSTRDAAVPAPAVAAPSPSLLLVPAPSTAPAILPSK